MWPVRFYGNKELVVFIGGLEIPDELLPPLVSATLDFAVRHKSPMLYSIEGFPRADPNAPEEHEEEEELIILDDRLLAKMSMREEDKATGGKTEGLPEKHEAKTSSKKGAKADSIDKFATLKYGNKIHYVSTDIETAKKLHAQGHVPCVDAIIPGFTGQLLSQVSLSPVEMTVLIAPTATLYADFQSAIAPLKVIHSLIESPSDITPSIKCLYHDGALLARVLQETKHKKANLRSSGHVGMYG